MRPGLDLRTCSNRVARLANSKLSLMRIIESAGFYYPESSGGTEAYVSSLARLLESEGMECIVAAPSSSGEAFRYVHDGIEVFRYPVPKRWLRREKFRAGYRLGSSRSSTTGCAISALTSITSIPGRQHAVSGTLGQPSELALKPW